jgi:hypothetical protein
MHDAFCCESHMLSFCADDVVPRAKRRMQAETLVNDGSTIMGTSKARET